MELFAKEGSRGTPLAAIAERIGVTAPAITHHFGTKQALLLEIVEELDRLDVERIGPLPGTGIDRLNLFRPWAALLEGDQAFANLTRLRTVMASEALDPDFPAHLHFVERHRHSRGLLTGILSGGQRDGSIRPDLDVKSAATEIVAFIQGVQFQWLLDRDDVALAQVVDRYFDRLIADLAPPRSASAKTAAGNHRGRRTVPAAS